MKTLSFCPSSYSVYYARKLEIILICVWWLTSELFGWLCILWMGWIKKVRTQYLWGNGYPKPGFWVPIVPWRNGLIAEGKLDILWNFENSWNMPNIWQKMEKSLLQLAINPFFRWYWVPKNRISGTHFATTQYSHSANFAKEYNVKLLYFVSNDVEKLEIKVSFSLTLLKYYILPLKISTEIVTKKVCWFAYFSDGGEKQMTQIQITFVTTFFKNFLIKNSV